MKISKKDSYGIIGDQVEEREILYCPYCSRFDVTAILQYRKGYNASDKEKWRECPNCTRILPATTGKKKGQLKGVVDPISSPFDTATVTGNENKKPKSYMQKYKEQLLDKASKEKDAEVRREILKGMEVTEGMKEGTSYVDS
jgi:hypothetical protein